MLRTDIGSEDQIRKLVSDIAPRYAQINGGYTRITRTRYRDGDKALMARMELVQKAGKKEALEKESKNEKKIESKKVGGKKTLKKEEKA